MRIWRTSDNMIAIDNEDGIIRKRTPGAIGYNQKTDTFYIFDNIENVSWVKNYAELAPESGIPFASAAAAQSAIDTTLALPAGGGGGGVASESDTSLILIDDQGGGIYTPFILHVNNDGAGSITVRATQLDGTTSYTILGTARTYVPSQDSTVLVTPTINNVTTSGSTTSGVRQVSVVNDGGANGTFAGVTLEPGDGYTFGNLASNVRIDSIAYDATGTSFLIVETP